MEEFSAAFHQESLRIANRGLIQALAALWDANPEQRFGQLVMNLSRDSEGFADTWEWRNSTWHRKIDEAHATWGASR